MRDETGEQKAETVSLSAPRRKYVRPRLVELGTVADLTLGGTSVAGDGVKGAQKPAG